MKINDYAVIGDGRSAALVSRAGSVDWLCWPRFDSPPIFGALLDEARGGRWLIRAAAATRTRRRYIADTNVLETAFEAPSGTLVVTDAMAVTSEDAKRRALTPEHELMRQIRCISGSVDIEVIVEPRCDFGRARTRSSSCGALGIRWEIGSQLLELRADLPLRLDDGVATCRATLTAGDVVGFSLCFEEDAPAVMPLVGTALADRLAETADWWRQWAVRARYEGPHREAVVRSALALKLMSFAPSGAIIAAATTSLPESEGGDANWDYRFCWLRDASFTARVLLDLGYLEDAEAFCSWLLHSTRLTRPELRVLYDVYGNRPDDEQARDDVAGYHGSRPVRIGNAAYGQLQLDMYGEVIDATAQVARVTGRLDRETQKVLRQLGTYVLEHWAEPDAGIWEPREPARHRTHSRLMCWVALDRILALHRDGLLTRIDVARFERERAAIRADAEQHAFDPQRGCYTGQLGPSELDAAVLLMSWYGFHPADDARMRSTYERLRERLGAGRGLLYRYEESLRANEGAFGICSFWAVEHLVRGGGTLGEARDMFDAACSYANDVGLMAEEVEPVTGDALGNFPQAYTHVGLVSAALSLAREEHR